MESRVLNFPSDIPVVEPSNIDAECDVLGAILIDPGAIARVAHRLPAEAFYIHNHRVIYQACLDLHRDDQVVDLTTVSTTLANSKQLDRVGGKAAIAELFNACLTSANVDQHADLIVEKHQRRCMAKMGAEIQRMANDSTKSIEASMSAAEAQYRELLSLTVPQDSVKPIREVVEGNLSAIERAFQGERALGVPTGFYDLDEVINGIERGELLILAGRPGMAKTSGVTNVIANVAAAGYGGYICSLEMSADALGYRMISADSRINSRSLRSGAISDQQWSGLVNSISQVSSLPVWINDSPGQSVAQISADVQRLQAENGKDSILLVMVDYIQLMGGNNSNRVQELSAISRSLKIMARELNVSVWALAQLNRGVESRTTKRPLMSDIKDCGAIEQDADKIVMLYREEYYSPDTPDRGIAEWITVKHRNGPTGTAKLLFEPEYTLFRNMAPRIG